MQWKIKENCSFTKTQSITLFVLLGFLVGCDITLEDYVTLLLLHVLCFITVNYIVSVFLFSVLLFKAQNGKKTTNKQTQKNPHPKVFMKSIIFNKSSWNKTTKNLNNRLRKILVQYSFFILSLSVFSSMISTNKIIFSETILTKKTQTEKYYIKGTKLLACNTNL